ncbi:putative D-xylose 1-dehydrogenase (NADP(+)) [Candida viswanathii]|uniref:D-xylose 1-dehydrogenase (NADP(+), D-xylono-1,5-lactone-forming) n=1 Tax=Candida viswanathii TaxID=5486 RepID=A0A367XNC3_9ASCO|nr:putative D-xylose 1-dehydrogenase (NADP(+)) [Candida viswanathii]
MTITLNWGILGAGNIASQFVHDLVLNNQRNTEYCHVIKSIGCSNHERGLDFIKKNNIAPENNYGFEPVVQSYDELYKNPAVDVVYVATPHSFHKDQSISCLVNGKHVLCEKPVTVNKKEVEEILEVAAKEKKYFMEGMWTRFFPAIADLKKKIYEEKVLGEIFRLFADLSYNANIKQVPVSSRIRDINLAAGALLDIGIYPITYSRILLDDKLGENHSEFVYKSILTLDKEDKVDHLYSAIAKYENGRHGILTASELVDGPKAYVRIEGEKGHVEMYSDNPARAKHFKIFNSAGEEIYEYKDDSGYNGFIYEANAVAEDISKGKLSNTTMPHDETLLVMGLMDDIRKENGLVYPQD